MTADRPDAAAIRLGPMRWWQIADLTPIEAELFGREAWSEAMFWSELAAPTRCYRLALDDAHPDASGDPGIVGYGGLCVYTDEAYIQTLGVRTRWQGSGVGTRLLEDMLGEAKRRGARTVALEVRADNPGAQRLYARHGFEATGLRRAYYQPSNVDAVVMTRPS